MTAVPQLLAAPRFAVRDDVPADICDHYVAGHPHASAYHRPLWLDVIRRSFGHETRYLAAESLHGMVGVLPLVLFQSRLFGRFAVSVPFFNYGGVLADSQDIERALLERAVAEATSIGATHLELRHSRQTFPELTAKRHKVAMHLALPPSPDALWNGIDRKLRNQVRKAEKSELDAACGGAELLNEFYSVFCRNMRDLGTPVYGRNFFKEVLSALGGSAQVFVVRHRGQPAAASITHVHGSTIEVPWASAMREFNPFCANVLLYWTMLQFATAQRLRTFDFGRSSRDAGTFHFKRQWGAIPHDLVWEYWSAGERPSTDVSPANPKFNLAIRVWQKLPLAVANTVGPRIVRNIP